MQCRSNEDENWKRQQAYLIRSLFHDELRPLSPVLEEEESFDSSRASPPRTTIFHGDSPQRVLTPLPPLIVERELPPRNKHDESEEYYQKLETKIIKIYKRMFIENHSDWSNISLSDSDTSIPHAQYCERRASFGYSNNRNVNSEDGDADEIMSEPDAIICELENSKEDSTKDHPGPIDDAESSKSKNELVVSEHVTEEKLSSSTEYLPKTITSGSSSSPTKSLSSYEPSSAAKSTFDGTSSSEETPDSNADYRQITFQADVHVDAPEELIPKAPSIIYEQNVINVDLNEKNVDRDNNSFDELLGRNNTPENNTATETNGNQHVEVMRIPRASTSVGSLQNKPYGSDSNHDEASVTSKAKSLEAHSESEPSDKSVPMSVEYESSIDYDILNTTDRNNIEQHENRNNSRKRQTLGVDAIPAKQAKYIDANVQTNYEDVDSNLKILNNNFFVGIPRVYNLCTCPKHLCRE